MNRPPGYMTLEKMRRRPQPPRPGLWPALVCFGIAAGLAVWWWC